MDVDPAGATVGEPGREAEATLVAGTQIGKYRLERVLGSGGMGVVWAAHDPDLDRVIAIKVLRAADASGALRARLLREARAMARLTHPHVATIYQADSDGDRDYIAMELLDGGSLDAWLANSPPRADVWKALLGAGRGLAAAHAAGLVHRDFKPHNVLRSRDGRVVVTDFGLARESAAPADATARGEDVRAVGSPGNALDDTVDASAAARPRTPTSTASVLGPDLTRTGVLIGTPAYMAPEQFDGATSDARTDQFAFCVTAWQALTGSRPFRGDTIDELRAATNAGVGRIDAKLAGPVRAVLERGLDPDPARRWPKLDDLLDALERARGVRRRRIWLAATVTVVAVVVAIGAAIAHRAPPAPVLPALVACAPAAATFDAAWSFERHAALTAQLGSAPGFSRVATALDAYRTSWIGAYERACTASTEARYSARLGCLLGERDDVEVMLANVAQFSSEAFDRLELPSLEACTGAFPIAPPELPPDPERARNIRKLRARLVELRVGDPQRLDEEASRMMAQTSWEPWRPITAEIQLAGGDAALELGRIDVARTRFQEAASIADEAAADRLGALARIGLLATEIESASDPSATGTLDRMVTEARAAARRGGADPELLARIDVLEAQMGADSGEPMSALSRAGNAYGTFARTANLPRRLAALRLMMLGMYPDMGRDVFLNTATTLKGLEASLGPGPAARELRRTVTELAWLRGDLDDVHRGFDALAGPRAVPVGTTVTGQVIDPGGVPAAGALVVVWTGELVGDGRRLYTDPSGFAGDLAIADEDGRFSLHAPAGAGILAERGELRSVPRAATATPMSLALGPTASVSGTMAGGELRSLTAFARFTAGTGIWSVTSPVANGAFRIERVPPGGVVGVTGAAGRRATRVLTTARVPGSIAMSWRTGLAVDVIARGDATPVAQRRAWVIRGKVAPRTRAELDAFAARSGEVASGPMTAIGADATVAGRRQYRKGDLHAVFHDTAPGPVTACLATGDGPAAPVTCATAELPSDKDLDSFAIRPP